MDIININLLGNPTVVYKNNIINFPYKKAEGLFYYACINKNISREEAINILWAECDETLAKKNLRDALYKIRKIFGEDIFLSTKKSLISINTSLINVDVDNITQNNISELYKGDFLANLLIKDCLEFEDWVLNKRDEYKNQYIKKVNSLLNEMVNIRDFNRVQIYSDILISNDPYNEKTYREIMKIYTLNGDYNKAIKVYSDLCKTLKEDLDIEPELSTKNMYMEILKLKNIESLDDNNSNYFYGRFDEIYNVTNKLSNYYNNKSISIVISGEAGIGKTALLNKIITLVDTNKFILLASTCYNAEKEFFLKPWQSIFRMLGEYVKKEKIKISASAEQIISYIFPYFNTDINETKFDSIERIDTTRYRIANEAIVDLLTRISYNKKIIFVFDDIQWMDDMSLMLLNSIIYKLGNTNVLLITSYRNDYEESVSKFTVPLISKGFVTEIKLNRFTKDEVKEIITHQLPNIKDLSSTLERVYNDTEGNALFLIELLKTIKEKGYTSELSLKATNIIKSRIIDLSKSEITVLNAISIFFDKTDMDNLKYLINIDELEIYEIIERLQSKYLVNEIITDTKIYYSFTHQKIRDYVYEIQSLGKRQVLHKKIAHRFEEKYKANNDSELYSNLIYHFERSGDKYSTLKYKTEYLKEFYTIYNETFPIISFDFKLDNNQILSDEKSLLALYNEIESLRDEENKDILSLKMEATYIIGRFYISNGEYDKGLKNINISKNIALMLNNKDYILLNYKQIIFYCIQVNSLEKMKSYIDKTIDIVGLDNINEDVGTILRLYGLYRIKTKDYEKATQLLFKAIDIFSNLNNINKKYSLSLAACYNYLGQMNKYIKNYENAFEYFLKSIEICNKNYITNGLGIFYSNAGQVLYELKNYDEAYKYLSESIEYFIKNNALWGRDIAECYVTLLEIKRGNVKEALEHFEIAKDLGKKIANPMTLDLISKLKDMLNNIN